MKLFKYVKELFKSFLNNKNAKKVLNFLADLADFVWYYTKRILRKLYKLLRKLPWKIITIATVVILVLFGLVFHFYIASENRIVGGFRNNSVEYKQLEDSFYNTNLLFSSASTLSRDMDETLFKLDTLKLTATDTDVSFQRRFITNYALRNYSVDNQLDVIYTSDNDTNLTKMRNYSDTYSRLLRYSNDLLAKDIEKDTLGYIAYLEDVIKNIDDIKNSNERIDIKSTDRIFIQILRTAEEYNINRNINQFNVQYSNVSSELYKEIIKSWESSMYPLLEWTSAQKSSYESIVGTINQKN